MNIPSLPTDNLYKFLAIFGLTLIIAGTYLGYKKNNYYSEMYFEIYSKSKQYENEIEEYKKEDNILSDAINKFAKDQNIILSKDSLNVSLIEELILYKQEYEQRLRNNETLKNKEYKYLALLNRTIFLNEELRRLDILRRKNNINIDVYNEANKRDAIKYLIKLCFSFGFIISMFGFIFWYYRIQKYEDHLIKANSTYTSATRDILWQYVHLLLVMLLGLYFMFSK